MWSMGKRFVVGCVVVVGWTAAQSPPAAVAEASAFSDRNLAGVYELALGNDKVIAEARAELRAGKEERRLALAGLLPQIQAGYDYIESDSEARGQFPAGGALFDNATNTTADTMQWDVSLVQPLFDAPAWFRFQQGRQLTNQAQAAFSVAQQDLIERTIIAYFEVLRAAANLRASRAEESAFKGQLDQVKQRFEVGMVAITDVHEAQAAFDLSVAQRIADEGQLGIAEEQLSVLTGRPHGNLWVLAEEFPVVDPQPVDSAAWVDFAREGNLDIQVAAFARNASQRAARAAFSDHLPRVDLSLSYSDSDTDVVQDNLITDITSEFPNNQERGVLAINFTLPVFTGGRTSANRRQAAARHDAQISNFEGTVRNVTQQTRALFIQVTTDVARSRARAQAVTSTRSALEAAEVGYDVGTRNVVDVLDARQNFFSAVRDFENSLVDYVQDFARLKRQAGTLSPEDVYDLNGWLRTPPEQSLMGVDADDDDGPAVP